MAFSQRERTDQLRQATNTPFDIAVIGGGITGCGIARDAALRGFSVLLLEQDDFASGTSSRSSRLVHGGLRYLEHGKLGLVHESVQERWRLMHLAPHLVQPLPFVYPVYAGEKPGLALINTGTFVYGLLAAFRTPGPRRSLNRQSLLEQVPAMRAQGLKGASQYYDCATNDARLTLENALDAHHTGATLLPRCRVTGLQRQGERTRLGFVDRIDNRECEASARVVVCAAGAWTDKVLDIARPDTTGWLRPTKGVHLVFRQERLPVSQAVVMRSTHNDHRITFAIPWDTHVYVGTTDTDCPDPDSPMTVTRTDADYMLEITNHAFPEAQLTIDDVVSGWAGLRPLVAPHDEVAAGEVDPSDLSREEKLETYDDHLIVVAGGKLTTYRVMAAHVVDRAARILARREIHAQARRVTDARPLPGGDGIADLESLVATLETEYPDETPDYLHYLAHRYGVRARRVLDIARTLPDGRDTLPGCRWLRQAELLLAIREEYATTLEDLLMRRTYTAFRAADQGAQAAQIAADLMVREGIASTSQAGLMLRQYLASLTAFKEQLAG